MDHKEAERTHAADRYLLGELSAGEREQFEEHFFSCPECAEEVRAGAVLRANARAVFQREERPLRERLGWRQWLSSRPAVAISWALASVLAIFSGYQNIRIV